MEGVSEFIVGTCQLRPKSFSDVFDSKQFSYSIRPDYYTYNLMSGSYVEFYIKPMHSYIDDADIMMSNANHLAFTDDDPVLPDDMRGYLDTVDCAQIMPYPDYPGFVTLRYRGKMRYNWRCKKFIFQQTNNGKDLMAGNMRLPRDLINTERRVVGPAIKCTSEATCIDVVQCIWCPEWPKEAKHWPFRRRNYGWPTNANIRNIVQNGCFLVHAKHPACRNDIHQWRLSFSNAEFCLIQSWTPVQQIVYHMLRFFAKRELIKKDSPKEDEVLSMYHFKTLMLWSCEEMSPEWWNSTSVIEICCNLLGKLSEWLKKRYCPNYFIPKANLFHERMNQKVVDETIKRSNEFYDVSNLNDWFAVKYIKPILKKLFGFEETMETVTDCGQYIVGVCQMLDAGKLKGFDSQFLEFTVHALHRFRGVKHEQIFGLREGMSISPRKRSLSQIAIPGGFLCKVEFSSNFRQFKKVSLIVHASIRLKFKQITYENENFLGLIREATFQPKVVRSKHHNFPKPSKANLDRSGVLLLRAQDLMENLTGLNGPQEFKLVSQLSKELLINTLHCDDFQFRVIREVACVYMASLCFSDSDYEAAIEFCSTVVINKTADYNEQEMSDEEDREEVWKKETLNAGCLFFIDDVVRIIGLYLLFIQIKDNFKYEGKRYLLDLRLTPEVFAHLLIILSNERRPRPFRLRCDLQTPKFALDAILITIINRKSSEISRKTKTVLRVYQRTDPIDKSEAPNKSSVPVEGIIQLLIEYSLENMTSFYNSICKDFGIHCNTVNCYRAAYLYKCRKYPEVLHLCERILSEPDLQFGTEGFTFANVILVVPPLDSYFDSDIQCLVAFHTLIYYPSSLNGDCQKIDDNPTSNFRQWWTIKSHHLLGKHFLARYLILRCLLDCNHSMSEVVLAFLSLKPYFPLGYIIRCFLRQKLQRVQ